MRNKLALVVAIVLGLIAVYGVHQYLAREKEQYRKEFRAVRVVAAAERIKAGVVIRPKMLSAREMSEAGVTADHILLREEARLIGQTINRSVERGEPLLSSYFRQPVQRLQDRLDDGWRAITLRVDLISGVAGNVAPGSRVDILGTFPGADSRTGGAAAGRGGAPAESQTVVMLTNVKILAVDNRTREMQYITTGGARRRASYGSVTVAVTPDEASILVYAQQYGVLTLALRSPADRDADPAVGRVDNRNLLQRSERARKARAERMRREAPMYVAPAPPE